MQHSDKKRIYLNRIIKLIVFITIFISINKLMVRYLSPSAHKSNEMWNYYQSQDDVDTLIIGSSVAEMISENVVNSYTGRVCINMGTPSQYFATSRQLLELSTKQKPIDTVILMMGFDALERDEDLSSTASVERAYYDSEKPIDRLNSYFTNNINYSFEKRNITSTDSINKWMSWPVNCTVYFDEISTNLEKKEYYKDIEILPANTDFNQARSSIPKSEELSSETYAKMSDIKAINISKNSVEILSQMGKYCQNNGITFIVIVSPHKSGYAQSFGEDYEKINTFTKGVVEKSGGVYLNLNDNPDVMNLLSDEYFEDSEHVTEEGVEVASGVLSDILNLLTGKRK